MTKLPHLIIMFPVIRWTLRLMINPTKNNNKTIKRTTSNTRKKKRRSIECRTRDKG